MTLISRGWVAVVGLVATFALFGTSPVSAAVPKTVKDRLVIGDPVWKELPVKAELADDYDACWKKLVDIIVDKGYDIGFMEQDSGYIRTNPNTGIVRLKSSWIYEIKVVAKLVLNDAALRDGKKVVDKLRVQVQGNVYKLSKGVVAESYSGYDKIVLQDVFNDLQLVFGRQ